MNNDKIDFVITWVDGSDANWIKEYNKYSTKKIDECRYRDWNILKYWFRAVEKNAPWVNKIYFVTCGHIPEWLETTCNKLVIVKHEDFIDKKYLPTFNSCVIELNLHKIKGLSEQFVYFNDDMLINSNVEPNDFFVNGVPCNNLNFFAVRKKGKNSSYINLNCMNIIKSNFNIKPLLENGKKTLGIKDKIKLKVLKQRKYEISLNSCHTAASYLKKTLSSVWEKEEKCLQDVCMHKFRTNFDVSQWLFEFWQLAENNYIERTSDFSNYFNLTSKNINDILLELKKEKYKVICLNDGEDTDNFEVLRDKLIDIFEIKYPEKSIYEKSE